MFSQMVFHIYTYKYKIKIHSCFIPRVSTNSLSAPTSTSRSTFYHYPFHYHSNSIVWPRRNYSSKLAAYVQTGKWKGRVSLLNRWRGIVSYRVTSLHRLGALWLMDAASSPAFPMISEPRPVVSAGHNTMCRNDPHRNNRLRSSIKSLTQA